MGDERSPRSTTLPNLNPSRDGRGREPRRWGGGGSALDNSHL